MKHLVPGLLAAAGAILILAAPSPAGASVSRVRGNVVDAEGNPIPDVLVQLEFQDEANASIVKVHTNKKGGWIKVGLPEGLYVIKFAKEGFGTTGIRQHISADRLTEVDDVVLERLPEGEKAIAPSELEKAEAEQKAMEEEIAKLGPIYQDAMTAFKAKEWDTAATMLRQVLEAAPDAAMVHLQLGVALSKSNDASQDQAAEQEFRKALELDPSNGDALVALAALLGNTGREADAVDLLKSRSADFQDNASYQDMLGALAMNTGRSDDAKAAFTRVLELDPTNAQAHFNLAGMEVSAGNIKAAIAHLNKVVTLAPADSQVAADAKALLEALKGS